MVALLKVTHADNEVAAFLNGVLVYDRKTENDPTLADQVDLTPFLVSGLNALVVIGINWGGPANYQGSVTVGTVVTPIAFTAPSTVNGMVYNATFVIPWCCA